MAVFDLPMDELVQYQGSTPRPADHDAFWARALAELDSVEPSVTLTPRPSAARSTEMFDLTFTGVRGARIHAQYLRPTDPPGSPSTPRPVVLMFHGYTGDSGDWSEKLPYVAQGFCVAALDCRGQGGSSEDVGAVQGATDLGHIVRGLDGDPDDLLLRQIYLDCAQLARIVLDFPEVDAGRVGTTGVSQGGGLSLVCASLEPRVGRVVSVFPGFCDLVRTYRLALGETVDEELRRHFRRFDPLHDREDEIFARLGYVDVANLTDRIRGDVLMLTALMDEAVPASTQFAAYNRIRAAKDMIIYPDHHHEPLPRSNDAGFEFLCGL